MDIDEPVSSSEALPSPALATEEGLSTPVAGPEAPFRPTSGMPGLTPTGVRCHVWRLMCELLTYSTYLLGLRNVLLLIISLPCFCNSLSVFYFKLMSNLVIFGGRNKIIKKSVGYVIRENVWGSPHTPPQACLCLPVCRVPCHPDRGGRLADRRKRHSQADPA